MTPMSSTHSEPADRRNAVDGIAGLLAAASLALSLLALARTPALLASIAAIIGLAASRMSPRVEKLAFAAVGASVLAFVVGMTIAVITEHSLL
jgi:hypothetical protein